MAIDRLTDSCALKRPSLRAAQRKWTIAAPDTEVRTVSVCHVMFCRCFLKLPVSMLLLK